MDSLIFLKEREELLSGNLNQGGKASSGVTARWRELPTKGDEKS